MSIISSVSFIRRETNFCMNKRVLHERDLSRLVERLLVKINKGSYFQKEQTAEWGFFLHLKNGFYETMVFTDGILYQIICQFLFISSTNG